MRLIDADKARAALEQAIRNCDINNVYDRYYCDGLQNAKLCLAQPTIEERKHGHWIEHPTLFGTWVCSECGMTIYNFYKADKLYIYCPKCGAKMDGENNG